LTNSSIVLLVLLNTNRAPSRLGVKAPPYLMEPASRYFVARARCPGLCGVRYGSKRLEDSEERVKRQ
jgi:hypothetical protein